MNYPKRLQRNLLNGVEVPATSGLAPGSRALQEHGDSPFDAPLNTSLKIFIAQYLHHFLLAGSDRQHEV